MAQRARRVLDDQYTSGLLDRYTKTLHKVGYAEFKQIRGGVALEATAEPLRRRYHVRTAAGAKPKRLDRPVCEPGFQPQPYTLIVEFDMHGTVEFARVRRVVEQQSYELAIRIGAHAARPGAICLSLATARVYWRTALSTSSLVVLRPKLKRMALCASSSFRPSARST